MLALINAHDIFLSNLNFVLSLRDLNSEKSEQKGFSC